MSKLAGKLIGLAIAAAGVYVVGKYLHDYTDYKAAKDEDLEGIRQSGSNMKDAVKRTYVAIREKNDVKEPAGEVGHAIGQVAVETGKLVKTVGVNTAEFVKSEKERYDMDPKAFRQEVSDNFKDMGHQAARTIKNIKEDAVDVAYDIKNAAENIKYNAKDFVDSAKPKSDEIKTYAEIKPVIAEAIPEDNGVVISEDTEKLN